MHNFSEHLSCRTSLDVYFCIWHDYKEKLLGMLYFSSLLLLLLFCSCPFVKIYQWFVALKCLTSAHVIFMIFFKRIVALKVKKIITFKAIIYFDTFPPPFFKYFEGSLQKEHFLVDVIQRSYSSQNGIHYLGASFSEQSSKW